MVKQVESNSLDLSGFWTAGFIMTHQLKGELYGKGTISDIAISLWNSTEVPNGNPEILDSKKLVRFLNASEKSKEQIHNQIKSKLKISGTESPIKFLDKFRSTDLLKTIYHNFMTVSSQNKLGFTDGDLIQFAINISEQNDAEFNLDYREIKALYTDKISPLIKSIDFSNDSKSVFRDISHIYNEIFKLAKSCGLLYSWTSGNAQDVLDSLFTFTDSKFYPTKDFITLMEEDPKNVALLSRVFNQWQSTNFESNLVRHDRQALYNSRILSNNYTKNALIGYRQFHKVLPVSSDVSEMETKKSIQNTQTSEYFKNISSLIQSYNSPSEMAKKLLSASVLGVKSFINFISKIPAKELYLEPKAYEEAILLVCRKMINIPQIKENLRPGDKSDLEFSDDLYDEIFKRASTGKNIDLSVKLAFWNILWLTDCLKFYQLLFSILPKGARDESDFDKIFSNKGASLQYKELIKKYINNSNSFEYFDSNGKLSRGLRYTPTIKNLEMSNNDLYNKFSLLFSEESSQVESLRNRFSDNPTVLAYLKSLGV